MKSYQLWLLTLLLLWLFQAWTLGISDDEAYYWVLAQKPSLGYAYHPPLVAWSIAFTEWITAPFGFFPRTLQVRLPAILMSAAFSFLALRWVRSVISLGSRQEITLPALSLLLLPGLAGAGWMMVPDLPLFLGWSLCWWGSWNHSEKTAPWLLFLGALMGLLSKFSAVLFIFSSLVWILVHSRGRTRVLLVGALTLGTIGALIPTLIWNAQNDWTALRYQFLERHQSGGSANLVRYLRFWASQFLLVGPAGLICGYLILASLFRPSSPLETKVSRFALLWILPAGLFWIQPLYSEFKAHWALVAWWPLALWSAASLKRGQAWIGWLQGAWSVFIIALFTGISQAPIQAQASLWWTGKAADPKWDVTNDLYGWEELPRFLKEKLGDSLLNYPVLGSRYQTASQAAFALTPGPTVSLVARPEGERQEWPSMTDVLETSADSHWPALKSTVLYVADSRYSEGPRFHKSECEPLGQFERRRGEHLAKTIYVWKCRPKLSDPS